MHFRPARVALLLATSSVAALVVGGSAPARAACGNVISGSSGPYTNPTGTTIPCVTFSNATVTGNVSNAGTITPGSPTGILMSNSTVNGAVTNSGSIVVDGDGILVSNGAQVSGGISNSGTISANAVFGDGISINGVSIFSGGISNSGTISANVLFGDGISVNGVSIFSGGISNSGTISANAVFGDGISVDGVSIFSGGISNSGTISMAGHSATGISVNVSSFSGGISNSGTISANGAVFADGIRVNGVTSFASGISNSGTISAVASAPSSSAFATGISVSGVSTFAGGIRNGSTGIITQTLDTSGSANFTGAGIGITNGGTFSGGVSNAGTISASVSVTGLGRATAYGINVNGVTSFAGGISNSGTISAVASAASGSAFATGISVSGVSAFAGGISNSGTISAHSSGISSTIPVGIAVGTFLGANIVSTFAGGISNSGTITAAGSVFGGEGISVNGVSIFSGGISNSGMITARSSGIFVGNVANFSGGISNSGTIMAGATGIFVSADASTFAGGITNTGVISGAAGIVLNVGGIDVLDSGTITGTGGTAIQFAGSGNTLTLGPGFAIVGNVISTGAANDTFRLGGTGAATFDASEIGPKYQNFATFDKVGDSTWTLTGTNTLVLPWTVLQGTLNVAAGASLANSPFTVQAGTLSVDGTVGAVTVNGGVLMGNGTLGGLAVNGGGTVAPGHSIGTLNVTGNVSFTAGSTYQVETSLAGQSDRILASGTATLTGGTVQVLAQSGPYNTPIIYTILTANGGRTGTFSKVTDNLPFLIATLSYDANDVFLTLARDATLVQRQAATPNQQAVAKALDRFAINDPLFLAVAGLTGATTRQALDALSGEVHASARTTLIDDSRFMRLAMLGRLRQADYAGTPGDMAALGYDGPTLAYQAPIAFPVKAPASAAPVKTPDVAFWAQGVGAWGAVGSDGNAASVSRNLAGFFSGFDARLGEFSRVGFAGGYTHSSVSVGDRASSADIDTAHIGAYAGTSFAGINLRSGAAFAFHTIDTSRAILFPGFFDKSTAHYDGNTGQIFGELGYGLTFGHVAVEPFAGAAWVRVKTDSFVETGGLAALTGAGSSNSVGNSSLGLRGATSYLLQNGFALIPRATVAWQHAFTGVTPTAALAFQSNGLGFAVAGVPVARDAALVEGGFDLRITPQAKFGLYYSGELATGAHDHAVKGNFIWNF
jgi:outer membrane autotransporter protein